MDGERFSGGTTTVVRIGRTVRRPVRDWSEAVQWLLGHLAAAQVRGVPRWHGVDEQGREVLDFLPGEVGAYPVPEQARRDSALVSAARLLRRVHDATADLPDKTGHRWWPPAVEPVEVVCHGDFAPYNCVFQRGETTGVFDFDAAHPGPRRWDLAHALYRFAPMSTVDSPPVAEQARRARLFLDAYGRSRGERQDVVDTLGPRLLALVDFMRARAADGDPDFARHLADGHADLYLRDVEHIERHAPTWAEVVVG
ncbi:phosphotransferase enzyme family protein [Saccharothrix australiensis]|uniref:Phosphotransferase family enzyme n=1 Tax=Saccharothrix australiensis TaxID=2072 RepID=A0A495VX44_9PSEU|nr:phosphotransferase [Saccharothrix australiensis]RKT53896.1 phosphotransferase family enzyme [Saccharothrix australiensis]